MHFLSLTNLKAGGSDWRWSQYGPLRVLEGVTLVAATGIATKDKHGFGGQDGSVVNLGGGSSDIWLGDLTYGAKLTAKTGGAGLTVDTVYQVKALSGSTFKVYASTADILTDTPVTVTTDLTDSTWEITESYIVTGVTSARVTGYGYAVTDEVSLSRYQVYAGDQWTCKAIFGIACGTHLEFTVSGVMRATLDGRDKIEVFLNGASVYSKESSSVEGYAWYDTMHGIDAAEVDASDRPEGCTYPYTEAVAFDLDGTACGDVIEIRHTSGAVDVSVMELPAEDLGFYSGAVEWTASAFTLT